MAIADQTTAAAQVRQFADLLADEPAVERVWYHAEPGRIHPEHLALDVWVQLAYANDDVDRRLKDAMLRVWPDVDPLEADPIDLAVITFILDALPDRNLEEVLDPDEAVELPIRRV